MITLPEPRLLKILFDFDNTTVKSSLLKAFWTKKLFGKDIPPEIFRKRMVVNAWNLLTKEEYCLLRKVVYKDITTAYRLQPVDGSIEAITALLEEGHFMACVTSQQGFGLEIAKEYFSYRKLPIACYGVGYGKSKAKRALKLKGDVFFDDDPHKLLQLQGVVPYLFLHDWAFNRAIKVDPDIIERAGSKDTCAWERFYERIHQLEKGIHNL